MVSDAVHLGAQITQTIKNEKEEEDDDNVSISTTSTDECQEGAVVLNDTEDRVPYFGNVEVKNSSDVHFGNKTYYQGPVTIKQILYSNRDGEQTETNGMPPQLAIDNKCVIDGVNSDSGYRTDSVHPTSNGHAKTPNGTSNVTTKGEKWPASFNKKGFILTVSVMAVVLVVTIGLIVGLTTRTATNLAHTTTNPLLTDPDDPDSGDWGDNSILSPGLHLNDRKEWLAIPPKSPADPLTTPVPYVIIHHTATENCSTLARCKIVVQNVQLFHMESNYWDDIGYNFLVGGDGYAYEGRGWTSIGAHARGYNNKSIGIAFVGTFSKVLPPERQTNQAFELIKLGVEQGYIRKDYKLLGMNQVSTFESPGALLIQEMKKWPHWVPKP